MTRSKVNKGKERKLGASKAINRQAVEGNRLAIEHLPYGTLLIDPSEAELVKQPSIVPKRGTVIRDKQIIDLSGVSDFYVEARPSLDRTLMVQSPAAATASTGKWHGKFAGNVNAAVTLETPFERLDDGAVALPLTGIYNTTATPRYGFTVTTGGNASFRLSNHFTSAGSIALRVTTYPGGTQTTSGYVAPGSFANVTVPFVSSQTGIAIQLLSLRAGYGTMAVNCNVEIDPQAVSVGLSQASHEIIHNVSLLEDVSGLRYYKVIAQELLVSYMGSDLNNGGVISGARVSGGWTFPGINSTDSYDSISDLPYDSYEGRLSDGCHIHWMPNSLADLETQFVGQESAEPRRKLVCGGRLDDSTQSIRIKVVTIVEYFSDSPSYGAMTYGPAWADFDVYMAMLDAIVPAATENDKHLLKKIKQGLSRVGKWGMDRAKEEFRDPANWKKLISLLLM